MVLSDDFYYQPIKLDTINTQVFTDLLAKEGDAGGRGLKVTLTENGVVKNTTGIDLNLKWEHTSIADLQGLEPFEAVDLTKGIYKLKYPTNMLQKGTVKAFIQIIDNGGLAGSRNIKITVDSTVGDDTAIESSNEFAALVTALVKTNHMENLLNEAIANVTVDSEVITARNSTAKGKTFTVLDERIEEIEDDTYFPATNALVSPDFEAATGWTADKATLAVANNVASVTGNGTDAYANLYQSNTNVAVIGDKVYLRVRARVTNALCTSLQLSTTSFAQPVFINNPVANQWYDIYDVIDATATNAILTIRANYADAATANGKVLQVEKPVKINLTTTFGLLTPTVDQMYSLMSQFTNGHFKGTASLSQPALVLAKTLSMEAQFNAAIAGVTVDSETINARVGEDSTTHATLKARLDTEKSTIDNSLVSLTSQLADIAKDKAHSKVVVGLGSSVLNGWGATDNNGWFNRLATSLASKGYTCINKGIPGDNAQACINRFYADVAMYHPDYVVVGLSLANEGIITGDGETVYTTYTNNIYTLINMIRQIGAIPIICGCYPNNDYTSVHYNYCKQFNRAMEDKDVAFINFMGAVDDLTGKWITGTFSDARHPNDVGHQAMFKSIGLSLFDLLNDKSNGSLVSIDGGLVTGVDKVTEKPLEVILDDGMDSFSVAFWVKDINGGSTKVYWSSGATGSPRLRNTTGYLEFFDDTVSIMTDVPISSDGLYHHVVLTFSKKSFNCMLYVDGILKGSASIAGITSTSMIFANNYNFAQFGANNCEFKDILIYRTVLNAEQVQQLFYGNYLAGSLEIYAPLADGVIYNGARLLNLAKTKSYLKCNSADFTSKYLSRSKLQ